MSDEIPPVQTPPSIVYRGSWIQLIGVLFVFGSSLIAAMWAISANTQDTLKEWLREHNKQVHVGALTMEIHREIEIEQTQRFLTQLSALRDRIERQDQMMFYLQQQLSLRQGYRNPATGPYDMPGEYRVPPTQLPPGRQRPGQRGTMPAPPEPHPATQGYE